MENQKIQFNIGDVVLINVPAKVIGVLPKHGGIIAQVQDTTFERPEDECAIVEKYEVKK